MIKIKKFFLAKKSRFETCYRGFLIYIDVDRENSNFKLSTRVFSEELFIPNSIRDVVSKINQKAANKNFPSYLLIDEDSLSVNFIQQIPANSKASLFKLIKLFVFCARSWAPLLKRLADNDLFYV